MELEEAQRAVSDAYDAFGLDCGLDSFETAFFLTDHIRSTGFVSTRPVSQVGKIVYDTAFSWYSFFHGLIVPNPQSLLMTRESNALSEGVKKRISEHMDELARYHRMGQHANETNTPGPFETAVRAIVSLRFSTLGELFDDIQEELDRAWSQPNADEHDLRVYG